mmetsp:Transcript_25763/g.52414  ORF Transcript_25763/g.52414 Transcript_25763/m.52414 type:complete len:311 (-) Transcript_25763:664-1596(-)
MLDFGTVLNIIIRYLLYFNTTIAHHPLITNATKQRNNPQLTRTTQMQPTNHTNIPHHPPSLHKLRLDKIRQLGKIPLQILPPLFPYPPLIRPLPIPPVKRIHHLHPPVPKPRGQHLPDRTETLRIQKIIIRRIDKYLSGTRIRPRRGKGHGAPIIRPDDGIVVGNGTEVVPLFLDGGRIAQTELGDEIVDHAEDADVSPEVVGGEVSEALDSEGGPAGTELYAEFFGLSGVVGGLVVVGGNIVVGGGGTFHFVGLDVRAVVDVGVGGEVEIGDGEFHDLADLIVFGPSEGGRLGIGIGIRCGGVCGVGVG